MKRVCVASCGKNRWRAALGSRPAGSRYLKFGNLGSLRFQVNGNIACKMHHCTNMAYKGNVINHCVLIQSYRQTSTLTNIEPRNIMHEMNYRRCIIWTFNRKLGWTNFSWETNDFWVLICVKLLGLYCCNKMTCLLHTIVTQNIKPSRALSGKHSVDKCCV